MGGRLLMILIDVGGIGCPMGVGLLEEVRESCCDDAVFGRERRERGCVGRCVHGMGYRSWNGTGVAHITDK